MRNYTTVSGDTFDLIAHREMGSVFRIRELMEANPNHIDKVVFSGGITIKIPEIAPSQGSTIENIPPWRR